MKSAQPSYTVIPAKAGIHRQEAPAARSLDPRLRGGDGDGLSRYAPL